MKIEDYKKAEKLVEDLKAIEALLDRFTLGRVSDNIEFTENDRDFYNSQLFNVMKSKKHVSTGDRITIAEFNDGSGAKYTLSKQETIRLQKFIEDLLTEKLISLEQDFEDI